MSTSRKPRQRTGRRTAHLVPGIVGLGLLLAIVSMAQPAADPQNPVDPNSPAYGTEGGAASAPEEPPPYGTPEAPGARAPRGGPADGYTTAAPYDNPAADPAASANAPNAGDGPAGLAGSYGYLRLVEGSASLSHTGSAGDQPAEPARANQPVQTGDQITVPSRGRVEIVLADHDIVRLDGDSRLVLRHLANSADLPAPATELHLEEGNLQLIVAENSVGQQLPTVLTPNAGVYFQAYGSYRITTDRGSFSEVVVRRGTAEVVSQGNDQTVQAGEEAVVDSQRGAGVRAAGEADSLEAWARQLDQESQAQTRTASAAYVDPSLGYEASQLDRYGHWLNVDDQQYWQPDNQDSGWTPYWQGSWDYTPSGMTWVSDEPWGWVPYHYGSWQYLANHGWAWQPGYVYSPAWVYWYWGPSSAGWCPIGLYTGFYGGVFSAFRFGIYGWAGGVFSAFAHWHFVPLEHFFGRGWQSFAFGFGRHGFSGNRGFLAAGLPRGLITTSTRGLSPALWRGNPGAALHALEQRAGGLGRGLADVTPFVARQARLSNEVAGAIAARSVGRLAGTPLAPHTLGVRPPAAAGQIAHGAVGRGGYPGEPGRNGYTGVPGRGATGPQPARPGATVGAEGWRGGSTATARPTLQTAPHGEPGPGQHQAAPHAEANPGQHPPGSLLSGYVGDSRGSQLARGAAVTHYPAHPAPASPRAWSGRDGGSGGAYGLGAGGAGAGRTAGGWSGGSGRADLGQPGAGSRPGYDSAFRSQQGARGFQATPENRSAQRYQAAPRFDAAPRYQAAPRFDTAPRYQAAPPRYPSAPRSYSTPRSSAPRPAGGTARHESGGGHSGGGGGHSSGGGGGHSSGGGHSGSGGGGGRSGGGHGGGDHHHGR